MEGYGVGMMLAAAAAAHTAGLRVHAKTGDVQGHSQGPMFPLVYVIEESDGNAPGTRTQWHYYMGPDGEPVFDCKWQNPVFAEKWGILWHVKNKSPAKDIEQHEYAAAEQEALDRLGFKSTGEGFN